MNATRKPRWSLLALPSTVVFATMVALATPADAGAQTLLTESFSNIPPQAHNVLLNSTIAGTGLQVTDGWVQIITDPTVNGRGDYMWMPLGWYQPVYNQTTNIGTAAFKATQTFDLFAGVQYTLSFDWTRQGFSAGNGPFPFSLTAYLGTQSLQLDDNAGFYYGDNWQTAQIAFTPQSTQLGATIKFAGSGFAYSGVYLDNISMVGVGTPTPPAGGGASVVPEPSTWMLLASGLGILALMARRRSRDGMQASVA